MQSLREDAEQIIRSAISAVLPEQAVYRALEHHPLDGNVYLAAIGKAAWRMASAAEQTLKGQIRQGIVLTKYGHSQGSIRDFQIIEAGHPIPDENSCRGAEAALQMVSGLTEQDTVLFLISGGGSALFEKSLIPLEELQDLTTQLMNCGAQIGEINTIRKRLSGVKAGRFAQCCAPARVFCVVLSDVLGDRLDLIASGPACPDPSTGEDALRIVRKYGLRCPEKTMQLLMQETPKRVDRVETVLTGSVSRLCEAVREACERMDYRTEVLTDSLCCEAREAGSFLASIARYRQQDGPLAVIAGGETVVHVCGNGLGGRNQELALAAAAGLDGLTETAVFSFGSDGTDGPTDAAGGYADGRTMTRLREAGTDWEQAMAEHDSYHALDRIGGLIRTGPTGTNVNDAAVLLIR